MFRRVLRRLRSRKTIFALFAILFISAAYILGWSSLLTVKQVNVVGAPTRIDRELVAKELPIGLRMARLDTRSLIHSLNKYSWLKDAQVKRNWFRNVVTIKVQIRRPLARIDESFIDAEGVQFSLPHPERFNVPIVLAESEQAKQFAVSLIASLPTSFRETVTVASVEGLQSATLLLERKQQDGNRELTVRWGDSSNTSLKIRVFNSLLALPENVTITFMDLSAPHAPIVR